MSKTEQIKELYAQGLSIDEIVKQVKTQKSYVKSVCAKQPSPTTENKQEVNEEPVIIVPDETVEINEESTEQEQAQPTVQEPAIEQVPDPQIEACTNKKEQDLRNEVETVRKQAQERNHWQPVRYLNLLDSQLTELEASKVLSTTLHYAMLSMFNTLRPHPTSFNQWAYLHTLHTNYEAFYNSKVN